MSTELQVEIAEAVEHRRNFAIISHPDAGKTTLTEKLLLYGGAIHEAGAVKARRAERHATSDWMAMEQQRGISITSTVLQFVYGDAQINLLDTPGHQDFSEDTYRTLAAADNAVMLIDAAKGLEPQTRKLFEVCQMRKLPIFTFVNKLDRPGRGDRFKGIFDRRQNQIHLFERSLHGRKEARDTIVELGDPNIETLLEPDLYHQLKDELELLSEAGSALDLDLVRQGKMTPIFFGSAMTNFGVELFLDAFLDYAMKPGAYSSTLGPIEPTHEDFTGFVFKLQANMDPKHRDRVAFVRVCTGKFEKDMTVQHARTGKSIRLSRPQKLFAQGRESIDAAYPGDVIGLNNPGMFAIGDTIFCGKRLEYAGIPCFSPELFAYLKNPNPSKFKQFQKGVSELQEEGAIQIMYSVDESKRDPILAAVGQLQFEVIQFRLQNEYGVETTLELLPYTAARWVTNGWEILDKVGRIFNAATVKDGWGRPVLLFRNEWNVQQLMTDHPSLTLSRIAPVVSGTEPGK
jgi:peptide chain release factor 3